MHEDDDQKAKTINCLRKRGSSNKHGQNVMLGAPSLQEMINRLSHVPLLYQPGRRWVYGIETDIQAYLIEKLSGEPFPQFLKEHIFNPLSMKDTGFFVPHDKWPRFATCYAKAAAGGLIPSADVPTFRFDREPDLPSGSGGLVSTASDFLKFAQMLLSRGQLAGVRILGPKSVDLMTADHLLEPVSLAETLGNWFAGVGWGYDVAVVANPILWGCPCGKGTYWWGGAAGTWFWIDPTDDVLFIGMTQRLGDIVPPNVLSLSQQTLYQALVDEKK